jgi:hypothetical protein
MKLKIDEEGHAVLQDGKPVYVHDDGKEIAFDAAATVATINRVTEESKRYKERAQTAEESIKAFDGIEDPAAAKKAMETIKNLDQKKLVDAGEIETVKSEISKAFQAQLDEASQRAQALEAQLYQEKIGGSFARSKFISEKLIAPTPMVEKTFGEHFRIEDGKTRAYDADGNLIYSRSKPGEPADFEEALEVLVENFPYKDSILKAKEASGGDVTRTNGAATHQKKGDIGGSREDRVAAIAAKFPDLAKAG